MAAASAVVALGCTAACGGGGGGGEDGSDAEKKPSKGAARAADDAKEPVEEPTEESAEETAQKPERDRERDRDRERGQDAPLTKAQLKKAALATGDVKGFQVAEMPAADIVKDSVPAHPAACQPMADMFLYTTNPTSEASLGRTFAANDAQDASTTSLTLLSYTKGDADKVLSGLRTAAKKCTAYKHTGYQYTGVKPSADPELGDEAVAYRLMTSIEGLKAPAAFTVVRSGTTVVAFSTMAVSDPDKVKIPSVIIEAQMEKLKKLEKPEKR
ncbi:hypothetical protein FE633_44195 [Streptomyces montanus]|uniref:Sensor domain-containing protein n=1 Tax=Streptomyces montanus TaxID=2580423 RepID=A0A5R9FCK7_9ACTN|nr:hypothetical protein [Streptomyces montanus]TLS39940.1 hypothetical protein FE633_44195 [Streptomyces montanus]